MMFFYKKHRHKKHKNNKGTCCDKSGCLKTNKKFGLTNLEMDELIAKMVEKPRIQIISIN